MEERRERDMEENSSTGPLLEKRSRSYNNGEEEEEETSIGSSRSRLCLWLNRVLDLKEAKEQVLFSLPMILTNVFYYLIPLVSVMFAGHLGQLELAGSTLANSWATVTGFAFMVIRFPFSCLFVSELF